MPFSILEPSIAHPHNYHNFSADRQVSTAYSPFATPFEVEIVNEGKVPSSDKPIVHALSGDLPSLRQFENMIALGHEQTAATTYDKLAIYGLDEDLQHLPQWLADHGDIAADIQWLAIRQTRTFDLTELLSALPNLHFLQIGGAVQTSAPCRHNKLQSLSCQAAMSTDALFHLCSFPKLQSLSVSSITENMIDGLISMQPSLQYFRSTAGGRRDKFMSRLNRLLDIIQPTGYGLTQVYTGTDEILTELGQARDWSSLNFLELPNSSMSWDAFWPWASQNLSNLRYLHLTPNIHFLLGMLGAQEAGKLKLPANLWLDLRETYFHTSDEYQTIVSLTTALQCASLTINRPDEESHRALLAALEPSIAVQY